MIIKKLINYFLITNESFLNFRNNRNEILWRINYFPLIACLINFIGLLLTYEKNTMNSNRIIYMIIPVLLCSLNFILLHLNKQNIALFNGLILLPIINTILVLPLRMPFAFTFPIGFSIAAFLLYTDKKMINLTYLVCSVCMFVISYNDIKVNQIRTNLNLLVFNFINFIIVFYLIINFLRYLILESRKIINRDKENLAYQNTILEDNNFKIKSKINELQLLHKHQIESAEFSNRITSIITHDIKSPMSFIENFLKLYRNKKISSNEFLNIVPAIEIEIKYANELFNEMLIWSKEQALQTHQVLADINKITEEICQSYYTIAQNKGITLINELNNDVSRIGKSKYFKIILRNLIINAIKFTNKGGTIRITSKIEDNMYKISVIDNGLGISKEKILKIIKGENIQSKGTDEEFGTGYGLIFCVDLIQKSEGQLFIESVENKGSVFSFTVPIYHQKNLTIADLYS